MKKGCVIAAIVVFVLVALGVGGCVFFGAKYGMKMGNAGAALGIEAAIEEYQRVNPDAEIEPTNEAWAAVLKDFKMAGDSRNQLSQFIQGGKIVDIYKRPMHLSQDTDGKIRVVSAGKDGELGTDDDVDSSLFEKLVK